MTHGIYHGAPVWFRRDYRHVSACIVDRIYGDGTVRIYGQSSGVVSVRTLTPRAHRDRGCGAKNARGPLPPSKRDPLAECQRFDGKTMRHRFTGQTRIVVTWDDHVQFAQECGPDALPRFIDREPRKALQWLRNAVEVA